MKKLIGVWLDHSKAKFINIKDGKAEITTISSPYKRHIRIPGEVSNKTKFGPVYYSNLEYKTHHKKRHDLISYYKDMEKRLIKFDEILLFGPTKAKTELFNHLIMNKIFKPKSITFKNADKMTEKEMAAFVKKYFFKTLYPDSVNNNTNYISQNTGPKMLSRL